MKDFEKAEFGDVIEAVFGNGVFTADGQEWKEFHDLVAPLFSRSRMAALEPVVHSVMDCQIEQWTRLGESAEPVELIKSAKRLAFDVVAGGLIGIQDQSAADRLFAVLDRADRTEVVRLSYFGKRIPAIQSHFRPSPFAEQIDRIVMTMPARRLREPLERRSRRAT